MTDLTQFNKVLGFTTKDYLPKSRANPFVKWVGGKRALVPKIVPLLPGKFNTYFEPFVGGGALFFALESRLRYAYLSDINLDLIITYKVIAKETKELIKHLKEHQSQHSKTYYKQIRDKHDIDNPIAVAARFIYLNKTCYNGLYRVNKKGHFNTPIGTYKNPNICDEGNILNASRVLKKANIEFQSFEKIKPQMKDFVYCDPPYDNTFTGYSNKGFDSNAQEQLRDQCMKWSKLGAYTMVSNSDTEVIRNLYKNFHFHEVSANRNINCNGDGRGKVDELIITNY